MEVKDSKGKYTLKLDAARSIVYETPEGFWSKEDYLRYHDDYVKKIGPHVKGKRWATCSDLRNYKTSNITDEVNVHVKWKQENGLACGVIILDSAIVKMQMKRASTNAMEPHAVGSVEEANSWLKSQGF